MAEESRKARQKRQHDTRKLERAKYEAQWQDLADHILPSRVQIATTGRTNRGSRLNLKIIDSTATLAAGTQRSGMHSGITSPSRKWFALGVSDPALTESGTVKGWLHEVRTAMLGVFLRSNVYQVLPILYGDMGVFGTGSMAVMEDEADVIRCYDFPVGSYTLGLDSSRRVVVFSHEYQLTIRQLVEQFAPRKGMRDRDFSHVSAHVAERFMRGQLEDLIDCIQTIEPNEDYRENALDAKRKAFASCTYEAAGPDDRFLEESGFDEFPILAGRWSVSGNDVYASQCPGMDCIGDVKQLQFMAKKGAKAYDKSIDPPLVAPISAKTSRLSLLPGDVSYTTESQHATVRPLHDTRTDWTGHIAMVQDVRAMVRRAFSEDLFLMLAQLDRDVTATEIMERREEKMAALGPVLERLNDDVLEPLIDRTFAIMLRRGLLPEAPEELEGQELRVEYESSMAQAQKQSNLGALERFMGQVTTIIAPVNPSIMDKIDSDQWADEYAEALGIPPRCVVPDEDVIAIRQARAEAAQRQQMAEAAPKMASAAKQLSETDTERPSALQDLLGAAEMSEAA